MGRVQSTAFLDERRESEDSVEMFGTLTGTFTSALAQNFPRKSQAAQLEVMQAKGDHTDALLIVLRGTLNIFLGEECLAHDHKKKDVSKEGSGPPKSPS